MHAKQPGSASLARITLSANSPSHSIPSLPPKMGACLGKPTPKGGHTLGGGNNTTTSQPLRRPAPSSASPPPAHFASSNSKPQKANDEASREARLAAAEA